MLFISLLFIIAISIAAVAAYFSITGLVAVFSASALAIIIMGSVLEVGKLAAISYAYRYWNLIGYIQRMALLFFVVLLMVITSIGIFGFLSKAHLEKVGPQEQYVLQIERIDKKIDSAETRIDRNQNVLDNLDAALDKYIDLGYVTRGLEQREEQSDQRQQVETAISENEQVIEELNNERSALQSRIQEIELEVGPIKYIAEMIYGDDKNAIDNAVKILIIMLVCTFDPLAVMLLISANHAHMYRNHDKVRSEFSIFDKKEYPSQDEKKLYDDLSDEEKSEHYQKVQEYLKQKDNEDMEYSGDDETHKKYEGMVSHTPLTESETLNEDVYDEAVNSTEEEYPESPYKLHNLEKEEPESRLQKFKSSWLPNPKFRKK